MPWIFPRPQVYICSPLIFPLESCRTLPILPVSHFTHFPIFFPPHSALPFRLQAVKILFLEFSNLAGFSIVLCIEFAFTKCWMNKRPAVDQTQNSISNVYVDHCTYDSPCVWNLGSRESLSSALLCTNVVSVRLPSFPITLWLSTSFRHSI